MRKNSIKMFSSDNIIMLQKIPSIASLSASEKHAPLRVILERCIAANMPQIEQIINLTKLVPSPLRRIQFEDLPAKMINGPVDKFRLEMVVGEDIASFSSEVGKIWDSTTVAERKIYGLVGGLLVSSSQISNMFSLKRDGRTINMGNLLFEIERLGEEKRSFETLLRLNNGLIGEHSIQTNPEEALDRLRDFVRRTRSDLANRGVTALTKHSGFPGAEVNRAMFEDIGKIGAIAKVLTVILAFGFSDSW